MAFRFILISINYVNNKYYRKNKIFAQVILNLGVIIVFKRGRKS